MISSQLWTKRNKIQVDASGLLDLACLAPAEKFAYPGQLKSPIMIVMYQTDSTWVLICSLVQMRYIG